MQVKRRLVKNHGAVFARGECLSQAKGLPGAGADLHDGKFAPAIVQDQHGHGGARRRLAGVRPDSGIVEPLCERG